MNRPTCDEVHQALVDSIELRWKPLADGESIYDVPDCQLCKIFLEKQDSCNGCPLHLIGQGCFDYKNSAWEIFANSKKEERKSAALNMIAKLQFCLDKYFPKGWDK